MSKYGNQHLSRLKMGSKILEQKVSALPVDVGLLQQVQKMHDESNVHKLLNQHMVSHVIVSDLLC